MNGQRIKGLERTQAQGIGRRSVLMGLGAGAAAAVLATAGPAARQTTAQVSTPTASSGSFLVMRRYQLASDVVMSEVVQRTTEGFVPIVREVPGFIEYLNVDLGDGEGVTIGIFASQASAEESTERATAWAQENVAELLQGPPEVSGGPILLQVKSE